MSERAASSGSPSVNRRAVLVGSAVALLVSVGESRADVTTGGSHQTPTSYRDGGSYVLQRPDVVGGSPGPLAYLGGGGLVVTRATFAPIPLDPVPIVQLGGPVDAQPAQEPVVGQEPAPFVGEQRAADQNGLDMAARCGLRRSSLRASELKGGAM